MEYLDNMAPEWQMLLGWVCSVYTYIQTTATLGRPNQVNLKQMRRNGLPWSEETWHCYSWKDRRWRSTHGYGWQMTENRLRWYYSHDDTAATQGMTLLEMFDLWSEKWKVKSSIQKSTTEKRFSETTWLNYMTDHKKDHSTNKRCPSTPKCYHEMSYEGGSRAHGFAERLF